MRPKRLHNTQKIYQDVHTCRRIPGKPLALATARYMKNNLEPKKKVYVVGTPGLVATLREHQALKSSMGRKNMETKAKKAMKTFDIDQDEDVTVVVASSTIFVFATMSLLCMLGIAMRFSSTTRTLANYLPSGTVAPAAGSMVSAIETACGQQSLNMGKPSKALIDSLVKQHEECIAPHGRTV